MSLRRQLILIGALILLLPLAVLNFAVMLEESLRASQENSHLQLTRFIGEALRPQLQTITDNPGVLVITPLKQHIILDGYLSDWNAIPWIASVNNPPDASIKLGIDHDDLYLLLKLKDSSITYQTPGATGQFHEKIFLSLHQLHQGLSTATQPEQSTTAVNRRYGSSLNYEIYSDGPGPILSEPRSNISLTGIWQPDPEGSVVELKIPLPKTTITSINLAWLNTDRHEANHYTQQLVPIVGSIHQSMPVVYIDQETRRLARKLTPENAQLTIINQRQQLLFEHDRIHGSEYLSNKNPWRALLRRLLTRTDRLEKEHHKRLDSMPVEPFSVWEGSEKSHSATLTSYYPVSSRYPVSPQSPENPLRISDNPLPKAHAKAWVSLRIHTDSVAALADEAVFQVITRISIVMLIVVAGLFSYASWLSWRIRSLKQQIVLAVNPEHRFQNTFEMSTFKDELGELSREFADMLGRMKGYADYMETFASKFTHECRTPLAIVSSSLQLLANAENEAQRKEYLRRAALGTERISHLLTAMRQSAQLEASIQQQEKHPTDLVPVVRELAAAYQDLLPQFTVCAVLPCETAIISGNADLIAQAIDKLIENAKDFALPESTITLGISAISGGYQLWVENLGEPIADDSVEHLFKPFVSFREVDDHQLHLGLGLVIVKLIADFHHAQVLVQNRPVNAVAVNAVAVNQEKQPESPQNQTDSGGTNSGGIYPGRTRFTLQF